MSKGTQICFVAFLLFNSFGNKLHGLFQLRTCTTFLYFPVGGGGDVVHLVLRGLNENPDRLLGEHFQGTIFEYTIVIF